MVGFGPLGKLRGVGTAGLFNHNSAWFSPTVVEGYRIITGWAKLRKIYFHLEFSQPVLSNQLYDGNRMYENTPVINGTELRGLFCFDKKWNKELICKVALSPVSIEMPG